MRFAAIFLSLGIMTWASVSGLAGGPDPPSDQDRLQGWWIYHVLQPGADLPPDPSARSLLRISGKQVQFVDTSGKSKDASQGASFTIDPTQNPKTIDLHWLEDSKKTTWKGIYTLKEDEVRVAFLIKTDGKSWKMGKERPTSFDTSKPSKDSVVLVAVLKRATALQAEALKRARAWQEALNDGKLLPSWSIAYFGFGAVALSPDGKWIAASGAPGTCVRLWDTATGKETAVLRGHDAEVMMVDFSRDGKRLFTATTTEVRTWELPKGKQLQRIPAGPSRSFNQVTLSDDGKWFVSDPETEHKIAPDGRFVIATIRLWDAQTGKEVRRFEIVRTTAQLLGQYAAYFALGKGSDAITGTALSCDGKWVVAGTERGEFHLWEAATGKKIRTFGRWNDIGAIPLGFSPDGKRLVTSSLSLRGTKVGWAVRVWDVATGKQKHAMEGTALDRSLLGRNGLEPSLTDDGKWLILATDNEEATVKIWEVETGKEVRAFAGNRKAVTHASVSSDKKLLATYDQSGTARLRDVATGKELRALEVRSGWDRFLDRADLKVRVSKDAKLLVTWTPSRLTLWDLEKGKEIRSMRR